MCLNAEIHSDLYWWSEFMSQFLQVVEPWAASGSSWLQGCISEEPVSILTAYIHTWCGKAVIRKRVGCHCDNTAMLRFR